METSKSGITVQTGGCLQASLPSLEVTKQGIREEFLRDDGLALIPKTRDR